MFAKVVVGLIISWAIILVSLVIVGKFIFLPELQRRNDILQEKNEILLEQYHVEHFRACEERNQRIYSEGGIPVSLCSL